MPTSLKRVENWLVEKKLGSGAFSDVFRVKHVSTAQVAAMKVFDLKKMVKLHGKENVTTDKIKGDVANEVAIVKKLNHPNIIKLFETFCIASENGDECICAIMELAEGGELYDVIYSKGAMKEKRARKLFRQLISALEYLHANFVVHRDLKLENILLDATGNLKLADFGFSKELMPGLLLQTACGSIDYAAPEIIEGKGYIGVQSDIWSAGITLYCMLHNSLPFQFKNDDVRQLFKLIQKSDYSLSNQLSYEAIDLIIKLLDPSPRNRITISEIRKHPWVLKGFKTPPKCYLPTFPPLKSEPDGEVTAMLCYFGMDAVSVYNSLKSGSHCQEVAMYYYLCKRKGISVDHKSSDESDKMDGRAGCNNSVPILYSKKRKSISGLFGKLIRSMSAKKVTSELNGRRVSFSVKQPQPAKVPALPIESIVRSDGKSSPSSEENSPPSM